MGGIVESKGNVVVLLPSVPGLKVFENIQENYLHGNFFIFPFFNITITRQKKRNRYYLIVILSVSMLQFAP